MAQGTSAARSGDTFMAAPGEITDWRLVVLADAALETGVLGALPETTAGIAKRLDLDAQAVRIVLDALGDFGVVAREGDTYVAGPQALDDPEEAARLRHHARAMRGWMATGDRLRGVPPEDRGERSPEDIGRFLRALSTSARERAGELADHCLRRFPDARTALDVAGGHGEYGLELARRGLQVTLQDMPEVIEVVGAWPSLRDSNVECFPGDVFERLPEGPFDLVLCAGFTHTQSPEANGVLFRRLAQVVSPGGGVAVHTFVRGQRPGATQFAIQMLVNGRGGDTHGLDEYEGWMRDAGFGPVEHVVLERGRSLMLAALGAGDR